MEPRTTQNRRIHELKRVVKTAEERRQEIEVRVAAARLLQQQKEQQQQHQGGVGGGAQDQGVSGQAGDESADTQETFRVGGKGAGSARRKLSGGMRRKELLAGRREAKVHAVPR